MSKGYPYPRISDPCFTVEFLTVGIEVDWEALRPTKPFATEIISEDGTPLHHESRRRILEGLD